jgi:hypothetical protein
MILTRLTPLSRIIARVAAGSGDLAGFHAIEWAIGKVGCWRKW